ncbi:MAG TPA: hypothetical protein EYG99_03085 [Candidatus Pacebacteria bacterium]|nr:hypothetical protein [Candidatus Paceibacterota bacterium]
MYLIAKDSSREIFRMAYKPITKELNTSFLFTILYKTNVQFLYKFYSISEKDIDEFYYAKNTILPPSWLDILFQNSSIQIRKEMLYFLIEKIYSISEYKPPIMDIAIANHKLVRNLEIKHIPIVTAPSEITKKQNVKKIAKRGNIPKKMKHGKRQKPNKNIGETTKKPAIKEKFPSNERLAQIVKSAFTASFISSGNGDLTYIKKELINNFTILMPHVNTEIETNRFLFHENDGEKSYIFAIPKGFKLV